jgi:hydrogenase maturation factor
MVCYSNVQNDRVAEVSISDLKSAGYEIFLKENVADSEDEAKELVSLWVSYFASTFEEISKNSTVLNDDKVGKEINEMIQTFSDKEINLPDNLTASINWWAKHKRLSRSHVLFIYGSLKSWESRLED